MATTELDFLENTRCQLYDTIAATADPAEKAQLELAQQALDAEIDQRYEAGERYGHQIGASKGDTDTGAARREGKAAAKDMLRRVAKAGGKAALDFALSLPDTMPLEEVERATLGAVARGALQHQSRGTIAAVPAPRLPSKEAEASWLKEARLAAEADWRAAFPHTAPQRDVRSLSAEDLAFAEAAAGLAVAATSARREEDGRKRFRGDQEDARLYAAGEASARRIWPGR